LKARKGFDIQILVRLLHPKNTQKREALWQGEEVNSGESVLCERFSSRILGTRRKLMFRKWPYYIPIGSEANWRILPCSILVLCPKHSWKLVYKAFNPIDAWLISNASSDFDYRTRPAISCVALIEQSSCLISCCRTAG